MSGRWGLGRIGQMFALALALSFAGPAAARDHVLVLTISNYPQQPLPGVRHDAGNALRLAHSLGYDTSEAQTLKDEQLDSAGLRGALQQLAPRVQANDRVFVYYSGHGASMRQGAQCAQALVARDGGLVGVAELHVQLEAVKQRSRDVFVFVDACHSGGLADIAVTRSLKPGGAEGAAGAVVSAKVFNARDGEACHAPLNFSAMSLPPAGQALGPQRSLAFPPQNFSFVAAANEREVALDDGERGGLATVQLLQCAEQGAVDGDGSGQVSLRELLACAQQGLAEAVPGLNARRGTRWTAHTLEAYGNTARALGTVKALPAGGGAIDQAEATLALFREIEAGANSHWQAGFELPARVAMGSKATLRYRSAQAGYLNIVYLGSDRRDIQLLARNLLLTASPGRELGQIPIQDCPGGCVGDNTFLLLLSQRQLNTEALLAQARQAGRLPNEADARLRLACLLNPGAPACPGRFRNAGALELAPDAAVAGYAAQILVVRGDRAD